MILRNAPEETGRLAGALESARDVASTEKAAQWNSRRCFRPNDAAAGGGAGRAFAPGGYLPSLVAPGRKPAA